jgi:predicted DNA-binding transcriptional regulator YafY
VDRLERLVNLVAALIDTSHPLTRAEIRERIEGYSSDDDAFRRNFERDKELLRQMGFPLVTVAPDPAFPDDVGYRIPRELYELADPGLDDSELAALRLAAGAVQIEGNGGEDAVVRALRKLGGAADGGALVTPAGDSRLAALPAAEAAAVAFAAVADRRRLSFTYRGEHREVDPWRLSFHRGHWYLTGFDHIRGEERMYRLDRVEDEVSVQGPAGAFERPAGGPAGPPPPWRMGEEDEVTAGLLVDANQARWAVNEVGSEHVYQTRDDASVVLEFPVTNREALLSFVLGYLDHAEILGPPELRDAMVEWLESIAGGR